MAGVLWKELVWVFSPTKTYNGVQVRTGDYSSLIYPIPMAVALICIRQILTKLCFAPFGKSQGIKTAKPREVTPNPVLENVYRIGGKLLRPQILGLTKQLDMTEREIERWLFHRRKQDRSDVLTKFCQSCWLCFYYTCLFTYGLLVMWLKPWFWDITQCWSGYPLHQTPTTDIWWYYTTSLAFYWSLFISQFSIDVKRKDFWQMFMHHSAAILLLTFSWLSGTYRIGCIVLVIHDCADMFLEAGKMCKYAKHEMTCNFIFGLFILVWIATRLGLFPFWILRHTLFDSWKYMPDYPAYYTFNGLLVILLVLHFFWTYLILKILVAAVGAGHVKKDVRSSSDETG